MEPISTFKGRVIALPARDIDTDQIIPARYLKTIDKQGLGTNLFNDWRYLADGAPNHTWKHWGVSPRPRDADQRRAATSTVLFASASRVGSSVSRSKANPTTITWSTPASR